MTTDQKVGGSSPSGRAEETLAPEDDQSVQIPDEDGRVSVGEDRHRLGRLRASAGVVREHERKYGKTDHDGHSTNQRPNATWLR